LFPSAIEAPGDKKGVVSKDIGVKNESVNVVDMTESVIDRKIMEA